MIACGGVLAAAAAGAQALAPTAARADQPASDRTWDVACDVLVIGFGGAGACAAISAADEGAQVLLVDKAPEYLEGGNTRYSEQYNLMWTDEQAGYEFLTCMEDGKLDVTDDIIRFMAHETVESFAWAREHGGEFISQSKTFPNHETLSKVFGIRAVDLERSNWTAEMDDGTWPFFEYASWPNGGGLNNGRVEMLNSIDAPANHKAYWEFLRKTVESYADSISCWFGSPATSLVRDEETGDVLGAIVDHHGEETAVLARKGIVLACGSYEANKNMMETFADRTGSMFIGSTFNTGDGIIMAGRIGAQMWHMPNISGPFVVVPKPQGNQAWWTGGGLNRATNNGRSIFVTADGKRFMRECGYNHHGFVSVGDTYQNQQLPHTFYAIMDADGLPSSQFYGSPSYLVIDDDQVVSGTTIEELAINLGIDPEGLSATVAAYNSYCEAGVDEDYARFPETLEKIENGPFYGVKCVGGIVNCQGGPKRNVDCQVLDYDDKPIARLFSAGELGSFWGGIYIAGGNVQETCYTGRVAGRNAARSEQVSVSAPDAKAPENEITVFDPDAIAASIDCADNEFVGAALGIHGPIVVKVSLDGQAMTNIEVLSQFESPDVVRDLFSVLPARIIEANSTEVDGITGASIASRGLKDAVANALQRAGVTA